MEKQGWKTLGIIFMILCILETSLFVWGYVSITNEENKMNECYYNICADYPNAYYEANVCSCYNQDANTGEDILADTVYMD